MEVWGEGGEGDVGGRREGDVGEGEREVWGEGEREMWGEGEREVWGEGGREMCGVVMKYEVLTSLAEWRPSTAQPILP